MMSTEQLAERDTARGMSSRRKEISKIDAALRDAKLQYDQQNPLYQAIQSGLLDIRLDLSEMQTQGRRTLSRFNGRREKVKIPA